MATFSSRPGSVLTRPGYFQPGALGVVGGGGGPGALAPFAGLAIYQFNPLPGVAVANVVIGGGSAFGTAIFGTAVFGTGVAVPGSATSQVPAPGVVVST